MSARPARLLACLLLAVPALFGSVVHCGARVVDAVDLGAAPEAGTDFDDAPSVSNEASLGTDGALVGLGWPSAGHSTNSDPWLVANHDTITEMHPNVLVLDFFTHFTIEQARQRVLAQIDAIAEGSRYHGFADPLAPRFLNYQLSDVIDLTASPPNWGYDASALLPITPSGDFDMNALFGHPFAMYYGRLDPSNPSQYLTLCQLFELGIINELWLMTGDEQRVATPEGGTALRRPPLMIESKQVYNAQTRQVPGMFNPNTGLEQYTAPQCKVTARIAYVSPIRGIDCDLVGRSVGMENTHVAIPYLGTNGSSFFNDDFSARFGTPFNSWADLVAKGWCTSANCITYPSQTVAQVTSPSGTVLRIDPFRQGCGTAHFPPNARSEWDYWNTQQVQSRCEHYNMQDGPALSDVPDLYASDKSAVATYTQQYGDDHCGAGWQVYYRQSFPGYRNLAHAVDGSPMKNWWPFLFY